MRTLQRRFSPTTCSRPIGSSRRSAARPALLGLLRLFRDSGGVDALKRPVRCGEQLLAQSRSEPQGRELRRPSLSRAACVAIGEGWRAERHHGGSERGSRSHLRGSADLFDSGDLEGVASLIPSAAAERA